MQLRNKKTGEIVIFVGIDIRNDRVFVRVEDERGVFKREINSLAELNAEWEDVPEEPKEYWYIEPDGSILQNYKPTYINHLLDGLKSIGNFFETEEEAKKAVEKLKAWKRLKDKGLTFCAWKITDDGCSVDVETTLDAEIVRAQQKDIADDLDLLFGGEE